MYSSDLNKKDAPKKGRGRPKKDGGEESKFDTKGLQDFMTGGKKPKKDIGTVSKKHSLKEYFDEIDARVMNEAEQLTIAPAQQDTQVIKQGNKVLGTVNNPQLAASIKSAIGKGEMTLNPDNNQDMAEDAVEESGLQAYLGNKKYGKEGMDALRKAGREGASKEKMAKIRAKYDKMDEEALDQPATMEQEIGRAHV